MYCSHCGSYLEGSEAFCPVCGSPVNGRPAKRQNTPDPLSGSVSSASGTPLPQDDSPAAPTKKKCSTGAWIGIIAGAVALIAGIVLLIVLLSKDKKQNEKVGWEQALEELWIAEKTGDIRTQYAYMYPPEVLDYLLKTYHMTMDDYYKELDEMAERYREYTSDPEYQEYINSMRYQVTSNQPLPQEALDEVNEYYADNYECPQSYVSEGMIVDLETSYTEDGETAENQTTILMLQINGKWYYCEESYRFSFMPSYYPYAEPDYDW